MKMDKIIIHSDGGSRGNPGPAGIGAVIEFGAARLEIKEYIGEATNNVAEYRAVIEAIKKARQAIGKKKAKEAEVECYLDSELVVKQLNHLYKIREPGLHEFFIELWNLTLDFKKISFIHIRREKNKMADKLVNQALDSRQIDSK